MPARRRAAGCTGRRSDLNASDYPVPDFTAATTPDQLAEAELKLTASMLDYARQAQSGRMHWSQVRSECIRLSGAGFHRGDHAGPACGSRIETDRQHAGLCPPGAERPDALVAGPI